MKLEDLLQSRGKPITARALDARRRAHLSHYEALGQDRTRDLVESLFETTRTTIVDSATVISPANFSGCFSPGLSPGGPGG